MTYFPATAVIATLDRRERLLRTLQTVRAQDVLPLELVIVDASPDPVKATDLPAMPEAVTVRCLRATARGAAVQRNEGVAGASQPFVLFLDDDVDLEPGCLRALWQRMASDSALGGCSAFITNAAYHPPGRWFRRALTILGCPPDGSLAGRCVGPALHFPPAPAAVGSDEVQWLNLGCTLYRKTALPQPPFLPFFAGYSLMEDVALSTAVGRRWRLACPPDARLHHDSRPARYKANGFARERMEFVNRWFVMRTMLKRRGPVWALRQLGYQGLMLLLSLRTPAGWRQFPAALAGKLAGAGSVFLHRREWRGYSCPRS